MKRANYARWKSHRKGKGFSLVELVVVIIIIAILAVAVFAGGAAVIAKARTERAVSDLNNFERAISTYMFEKTKMVKMDYSSGKAQFDQIADDINDGLPQEYQLDKTVSIPATGAISSDITGQIAYVSDKKDPWGNNYWLLMDTTNRNTGSSEYFITVMSAGKNGKANVGGLLDGDDIFLLNQYSNGEVATKIYKMQEDTTDGTGSPLTKGETALTPITGLPAPRNIGENAKDVAHVHSWVVDSQTAATCTAAGVQHRRCTACGETEDVNLPAVGHNLTWTTTKQATCTENGMKRGSCTRCSYSTTQTIASPGHHTYGGWKIDIAATCTQAGERSRVCSVCSHKETESIPTSGSHSWGEWVTETAATCVAGGTEKHTCTRSGCGASETRATDPLGHDWKSVTKAATCTEAGYTQDECQRAGCSATQNKTTITALGHSYGSWATVTAATCTAGGTEKRTCTRTGCTAYETRTTDALGHDFSSWVNADLTNHKRTCSRNSTHVETEAHTWGDGIVTTQPTTSSKGVMTYTCTICDGTKTDEIPALSTAFVTFTSATSDFKISVASPGWLDGEEPGIMQYSTDAINWDTWDGTEISASSGNSIYIRGKGNNVITGNSESKKWTITGTKIQCTGNIETLLDYSTVDAGGHPEMGVACFAYMFYNCYNLSVAPELKATQLSDYCYSNMFYGCGLTTTPELPAMTLTAYCYSRMFQNCSGLNSAPSLNANQLAAYCYYCMFSGCGNLRTGPALPAENLAPYCYAYMFSSSGLNTAPALPATTLAEYCYSHMFKSCESLTATPSLPATELAKDCYDSMFLACLNLRTVPSSLPATTLAPNAYVGMFAGCTRITTAPALPATTLANFCYANMFAGCTSLTTAPALPATTLAKYCYKEMFYQCTALTTAPALPATTLAVDCYYAMFLECSNLTAIPALPATKLVAGCYFSMFSSCPKIKLSASKTGEYTQEYRVPVSGIGSGSYEGADNYTTWMFRETGGTFKGTGTNIYIDINKTYYLSSTNSIVK